MHFNCRIEALDITCNIMICGMKLLKRRVNVNSNHVKGQGRWRAFVNMEGKFQNPYRAENVSSSANVRFWKTELFHGVQ